MGVDDGKMVIIPTDGRTVRGDPEDCPGLGEGPLGVEGLDAKFYWGF